MNKTEKKVKKVMKEFKKGKLNIGKSKKKVKNRKQAIGSIFLGGYGFQAFEWVYVLYRPLEQFFRLN